MREHELRAEVTIPRPIEEVFGFFADAGNLQAITPPWLHFAIVTPRPIEMREGALIDYRLRVRGVPMRWRTRIVRWTPPHGFVDEQLRGPYRLWWHEHEFREVSGGTLATDRVRYAVPMDRLVHRWLVRPDVERIFEYRKRALLQRFGAGAG
ncbi:MAG: SRPBCC family protein [Phycisphaerae bacterium]|nr:SRPBCC family protein [Phycisphaerae bacterium]